MKTDIILKFIQNLFSKVIWSSTFKFDFYEFLPLKSIVM